MGNKTEGFTSLPHSIFGIILLLDLTSRERRVIDLILRLTFGCHKVWAKLDQADLMIVGILPTHAKEVLSSLLAKKYLLRNGTAKQYRVNTELLESQIAKGLGLKLERLGKLVGKQLTHSQNSNTKVTESETNELPKEELLAYQVGNDSLLPNQEDSASTHRGFSTPKDVLNKRIHSDINEIARNSFKEGNTNG